MVTLQAEADDSLRRFAKNFCDYLLDLYTVQLADIFIRVQKLLFDNILIDDANDYTNFTVFTFILMKLNEC